MASARQEPPEEDLSHYALLDVDEDADLDALTAAYRQRALAEHPDKGGDAKRFDDITKAFKVLANPVARKAYDEELSKARERAELVEGAPKGSSGMSAKQAQAPMARLKTEPTPGSKRQSAMRCGQPGNYKPCAEEWKGMGSAFHFLKAIADDTTEEQKTERLMDKYAALPRGKEKKREWVSGLRGHEKQELKLAAKKREEAEKAKWSTWLNPATQATKPGHKQVQKPRPHRSAKAGKGITVVAACVEEPIEESSSFASPPSTGQVAVPISEMPREDVSSARVQGDDHVHQVAVMA